MKMVLTKDDTVKNLNGFINGQTSMDETRGTRGSGHTKLLDTSNFVNLASTNNQLFLDESAIHNSQSP